MNTTHITTVDGILTCAPVVAHVAPGRAVVVDDELDGYARVTFEADGWRFADRYTDRDLACAPEGWTHAEGEHNPAWLVPFCACGRVLTECDGSRLRCVSRAL